MALWGLGVDRLPDRVTALGGKYFFDDDQQWPDTQYVVAEFDPAARISLTGLASLRADLADLLGAPVDLAEWTVLKSPVRAQAEREAVRVF